MAEKPYIRLSDFRQLPAVIHTNVRALRELAAQARTARDYGYAKQIDRQAGKWERVWKESTDANRR